MNRTKTVELTESELDDLLLSDIATAGIAKNLNEPASEEIKAEVRKALTTLSEIKKVPDGCYIQH
jgi:hypothetical protein